MRLLWWVVSVATVVTIAVAIPALQVGKDLYHTGHMVVEANKMLGQSDEFNRYLHRLKNQLNLAQLMIHEIDNHNVKQLGERAFHHEFHQRYKRQTTTNIGTNIGNIFIALNAAIAQVTDSNSQLNLGIKAVGEGINYITAAFTKFFTIFENPTKVFNPVAWVDDLIVLGTEFNTGLYKLNEGSKTLKLGLDSFASLGIDIFLMSDPSLANPNNTLALGG